MCGFIGLYGYSDTVKENVLNNPLHMSKSVKLNTLIHSSVGGARADSSTSKKGTFTYALGSR